MFQKAVRKRAKARIGICGPAGSGKTMSALKLAFGIVSPTGKIAVLDTENESASLYAPLGDYHVAVIKPLERRRVNYQFRTCNKWKYN
jgi:RecA/RadA recombinase